MKKEGEKKKRGYPDLYRNTTQTKIKKEKALKQWSGQTQDKSIKQMSMLAALLRAQNSEKSTTIKSGERGKRRTVRRARHDTDTIISKSEELTLKKQIVRARKIDTNIHIAHKEEYFSAHTKKGKREKSTFKLDVHC